MNLYAETQREMLRQMLTIRRFEERAAADYLAGRIYGVVHCYIGEEAVAVGVCTALQRGDPIVRPPRAASDRRGGAPARDFRARPHHRR